jgi:hypothetical protein
MEPGMDRPFLLVATLSLQHPSGSVIWLKRVELGIAAEVAGEMASLAGHEPIELRPYRDHLGLYTLFAIDLGA